MLQAATHAGIVVGSVPHFQVIEVQGHVSFLPLPNIFMLRFSVSVLSDLLTYSMAAPTYDLVRQNYVLSNPLEAARLQHTSLEFMEAVRSNMFQYGEGTRLMDEFCSFVSSSHVWHLAQNVVPEFRSAPRDSAEEYVSERCGLSHDKV